MLSKIFPRHLHLIYATILKFDITILLKGTILTTIVTK